MKFKRSIAIFSFLLVAIMCISSVAASEDVNIDDNNLTDISSNLKMKIGEESNFDENNNEILAVCDVVLISEPQTIYVPDHGENHNEMTEPTIQKAIDGANAGDTIVILGKSYVHCHFVVDKPLTIISNVGTTMSECPGSTAGSGYHGIFYVSPQASGTVIDGFSISTIQTDDDNDYGIFVKGASDVIIRNCNISSNGFSDALRVDAVKNAIIQNLTLFNANNGIRIINSENTNVKGVTAYNSNKGIVIDDSSNIQIISSDLSDNAIAGISYSGNGQYLTVIENNLTNNGDGIRLTSTEQINILSNYIAFNKNNGVYVDCNITKIEIKGNFFNQNVKWDIFNDFHVKNMKDYGNEREVITNNYMINYGFGSGDMDRPVWTQMYEYKPGTSYADYIYDEAADVFIYVGEGNGDYYGHQEVMFLGYIFDINNFLDCPNMRYDPDNIWSIYSKTVSSLVLELSEITQVKKGVYSISIVDVKGNIISDISSVPVTFYLNKVGTSVTPQEGDIYKTVMMKNGTATVTFEKDCFNDTGNVITAVFPTPGTNFDDKVSKTFNVNDSDIPTDTLNTKIISSNVYMVPNLSENYVVILKDEKNNVLANKDVTFTVNGKTYTRTTNSKGQATVLLKFTSQKTYKITTQFAGDSEYNAVSKTNNIIVKYSSKTAKLTVPSVTIPPKTSKYYTVTLKDGNGKAIAKQKVTIKLAGKTYTKTTNSNGKAAIKVKFNSFKTYKVIASYKGSKIYKKASAKGKIVVAKTPTKITAPTVSVLPKQSKTYTVTLKTSAGKALSKQKVTIKANGKTYTKTTNSKGRASISVKFNYEKTCPVVVKYKGNSLYKASKATGKVVVSKIVTAIYGNDMTYSKDSSKVYLVTLKDKSGNVLKGQTVKFTVNGKSYSKTTNSKGVASIDLSNQHAGTFNIVTKFAGNGKYKAVSKTNKIVISDKDNVSFVNTGLTNSEIQSILDNAGEGYNIEFLGKSYSDISLTINKPLNIYSKDASLLAAKSNSSVFTISANNVNISNLTIGGNSADAILICNASNVLISGNYISNAVDQSKIESYDDGSELLPGYGIHIVNSSEVLLANNYIGLFESGIFAQYSSSLIFDNNTLRENNYGIKYGFGVANTKIINNEIYDCIGLYTMAVPEGPSGYGIFLNNSAVNVTINHNHIFYNHMGISLDANFTTGIVITQNTITDNVLEGIRFNAGYDLAPNATRVIVTDNAIYRNARGPSMMILGELSANPEGIYGGGLLDPTKRLQLDANWYGKNVYTVWDNDTGAVGYGTMCPRINTTYIIFNNITYQSPGHYSVILYKKGELASNLSTFDLYATLNRGTDKQVEVIFDVVDGVGNFSFNAENYDSVNNTIEISIGSLLESTTRVFLPTSSYEVPESEIPKK